MNKDNYFLGVLLGCIVPILGVLFFYVILYLPDGVPFSSFVQMMKTNNRVIPKMLALGMIACIPLFTYYRNRRLYKTLYGIFIPVIFYAILIAGYRFNLF